VLDPLLKPPRPRCPWWCVQSAAWPLAIVLLAGCVAAERPAAPGAGASTPPAPVEAAPPHLLPIGRDPDGCMMYRVEAPGLTVRALSYRTPDGHATFDRGAADCPGSPGHRGQPTRPAANGRMAR
jgi:hypothetical protein